MKRIIAITVVFLCLISLIPSQALAETVSDGTITNSQEDLFCSPTPITQEDLSQLSFSSEEEKENDSSEDLITDGANDDDQMGKGSAVGKAYAVLTDRGTVVFFRSENEYSNMIRTTATDINGDRYTGYIFNNIENRSFTLHEWERSTGIKITNASVAPGQTIDLISGRSLFENCNQLSSVSLIGLDTHDVTDMSNMFGGCSKLTTLNLGDLDTTSVTNMSCMFIGCTKLTTLDLSGLNTCNVTNMSGLFSSCSSLNALDLSGLDTSKVTNMGNMFNFCQSLTTLNIGHFRTSAVENMAGMFSDCSSLVNLDVSGFDTSSVTNMDQMFYFCENLSTLDVSHFDTSNVTSMYMMFGYCENLFTLDVSHFDTSNVVSMESMFEYCRNLTTLDTSVFVTSKVTDFSAMFACCERLVFLDLSNFDTSRVSEVNSNQSGTGMLNMFYDCNSLSRVKLGHFQIWHNDGCLPDGVWFDNVHGLQKSAYELSEYFPSYGVRGSTWVRYGLHEHEWSEYASNNDASCIEDGTKTRECLTCGATETLMDEGTALGHDYVATIIESTCTEQGYTDHTCSRCGDSYKDTYTDALGHDWSEWTETTAATCAKPGIESRSCSRCDAIETRETESLGHKPSVSVRENEVEAGCEAEGGYDIVVYCSVCGEELSRDHHTTTALGHAWDEGVVTKEPGCTTAGVKTYTCTRCGDTKTEAIDATGHEDQAVVTEPTCTERGYTTHICSLCGETIAVDTYTDALGHDWSEWTETTAATCTEGGVESRSCSRCDAVETRETETAGHKPSVSVRENETEAGCETEGGYDIVVYCSVCGEELSRDHQTTTATGHDWSEPSYTWVEDDSSVTARSVCGNDPSHIAEETVATTVEIIKEATTLEEGQKKITAVFENSLFETQTRIVNYIRSSTDGSAYAVVTDNGYLIFFRSDNTYNNNQIQTAVDINGNQYTGNVYSGIEYLGEFLSSSDKAKVKHAYVAEGQVIKACSVLRWFYDCNNMVSFDSTGLDTSQVERMDRLFFGCHNLVSLDLKGFDTSRVTNMEQMFRDCSSLTVLDLSGFDTSNVTNMEEMFCGCSGLTLLDLGDLETGEVTNMGYSFCGCSSLTSLDLSSFDTGKVVHMEYMFDGCQMLESLCIDQLDTHNVISMAAMFRDCSSLNTIDLHSFDVSKVKEMHWMFAGCSSLTSLDLSSFISSSVTYIDHMFYGCSGLNSIDMGNFDTSNVVSMWCMFYECSNLISLDLSSFDTGKVEDMGYMFYKCTNLVSLDLSGFNTGKAANMFCVFRDCDSLNKVALGTGFTRWSNGETLPIGYWVKEDTNLRKTEIELSEEFVSDPVTYAGVWIKSSPAYAVVTDDEELIFFRSNEVYQSQTYQTVTDNNGNTYSGMVFSDIESFYQQWLTPECKTSITRAYVAEGETIYPRCLNGWFSGCVNLKTIDLSQFDTSHMKWMADIFSGCSSLLSLDLSSFDTSNVTDMGGAFYGCSDLISLDLSSFDTSKATCMTSMFEGCDDLSEVYLGEKFTKWRDNAYLPKGLWNNNSLELLLNEKSLYNEYPSKADIWNGKWEKHNTHCWDEGVVINEPSCFWDGTKLCTCTVCGATELITIPSFGHDWSEPSYTWVDDDSSVTARSVCGNDPSHTAEETVATTVEIIKAATTSEEGQKKITAVFENSLFETQTKIVNYIRSSTDGSAYAVVTDDGDLIFFRSDNTYSNNQVQTAVDINGNQYTGNVYSGIEDLSEYSGGFLLSDKPKVKRVYVAEGQTIKPKYMQHWFADCVNMVSFDSTGFDTSQVPYMYLTFFHCINVKSLDLRGFDTGKVESMANMFDQCYSLRSLDLSGFDMSSVTYMGYMFACCDNLKTVKLGDGFTKWLDNACLPDGTWTNSEIGLSKTANQLYEDYPSHAVEWSGTWVRDIDLTDMSYVVSNNVKLKGALEYTANVVLSEKAYSDPEAYMVITYTNAPTPSTAYNETKTVYIRDVTPTTASDGTTRWGFTIPFYIAQLNDEVTLRLYSSNGKLLPIGRLVDGDIEDRTSTGVMETPMDYLNRLIDNPTGNPALAAAREVAETTRVYGAAAQLFFNYRTDRIPQDVVNALNEAIGKGDIAGALEAYTEKTGGTMPAGITRYSKTLVLEQDHSLRYSFYLDGSVDISKYRFEVEDVDRAGVFHEVTAIETSAGKWSIEINNIPSGYLGKDYTFRVTDGKDTFSVTGCGLVYAKAMVNNSNPALAAVAKAMYLYTKAAEDYFS